MQTIFDQPALLFAVSFVLMWLSGLLLIVPLVVSLAFALIADIDSPRGGVIRVRPLNLHALADTMRAH
ncbi:hypothetical protein [Paraburkholderia aromaticivorans]|uniref:hypothetical protein n=1 Tax=Paraburkholderia aromaticivorans TaxID=2026199 RepID=UPI0012FE3CC3|nr:hypothetical protein [Paraburkholderia aromaticivorans]